ncbi:zinc-binding metallopeptidase family protein [Protaetiibacter larvae]|uniref:zinc-binding metallopeptidase family protein n=1 Tax=Protaetiibacter larvae TaxID=2592654 RepID=UPI001AEFA832|nr:putative zinc-binding metallopeptidase [Protaetiibacter larvae]
MPRCPRCGRFVFLDELACRHCAAELGYHHPSLSFRAAEPGGALVEGERWFPCRNRPWGCNWLVAEDAGTGRCFSCRLTRREPDAADTVAWEKLADAGIAKRRLIVQLLELGLPIVPYDEREGGLGFDLLSSLSANAPVMIGHANGIITIDLAETLDARREALRVSLGEPYRTMLGHFRHEIGHYYQKELIVDEASWEACRALFGDERASYRDALDRHYSVGAPANWRASFISEYATMHPWEDFAECFAHYLHLRNTLATAAAAGMVLQADRAPGIVDHDIVPETDYPRDELERMLDDWGWLSLFFNRVSRAMGQRDLYPFELPAPVRAKLAFIHRLVTPYRRTPSAPA